MRVTVMLGGPSSEREVSLRSGKAVAEALRSLGYLVDELDPVNPSWRLPAGTDGVFLALHGTYGEDGTVQRALDDLGIAYTGCDAVSSEIAFDKVLTKVRCEQNGVPTARHALIRGADEPFPRGWKLPVVLKPIRQGSSVGLHFVDQAEQWTGSLRDALKYDGEVLMEERVIGREVTVGILGRTALPVVEIKPKHGCYDYERKYTPGQTEYVCPAPFDETVTAGIQQAALAAFAAVGGRDYARVDIIVTEGGAPVVLEVNTLPGMTQTSLLPKAAAAAGISFANLCERMLAMAFERQNRGRRADCESMRA